MVEGWNETPEGVNRFGDPEWEWKVLVRIAGVSGFDAKVVFWNWDLGSVIIDDDG